MREFLEYFDLDYTCSVFDPETNFVSSISNVVNDVCAKNCQVNTHYHLLLDFVVNTFGVNFIIILSELLVVEPSASLYAIVIWRQFRG